MKRRRLRIALGAVLAVLLVICISFAVYVGDYYRADEAAVQAMAPADSLLVSRIGGNTIAFAPTEPLAGLIFYPGGKVEYTAYTPLMRTCAEKWILCVLTKSVDTPWAAAYAANHRSELNGLILLDK